MLNYIKSKLTSEYRPGTDPFLQIDDQELVEKLRLKERGATNGGLGFPLATSEAFDDVEQDIVNTIRTAATKAHAETHDHIATYAQRLKAADIKGAAAGMKVLARQSEGGFQAAVISARGDLEKAMAEVLGRRKDVENFRKVHRLERQAHPRKDHVVMGALLVIMFGIEIVPNASMLEEGQSLGFLGGITQASIYSFLNIALGFLSGLLAWTNVAHRNSGRKLLGFIAGLAVMAFIVGLNFSLAHYRTASLTMSSDEAATWAFAQLLALNYMISDLQSAGMVAMGMLFSFIATIEGYFWRDPYPGYAGVTAHLSEAEDTLHDMIDEKLAHLKDVREEFIGQIELERRRLRDKRQEIPIVLEERRRLIARFQGYIAHLQDVGRSLLAVYRSANLAARKDQGPKRFHEGSWVLDKFEKIEVDDGAWQVPEGELNTANKALETSVDKLQSAYEGALEWIKENCETKKAPVKQEADRAVAAQNA